MGRDVMRRIRYYDGLWESAIIFRIKSLPERSLSKRVGKVKCYLYARFAQGLDSFQIAVKIQTRSSKKETIF